jgi:hypothetical protein
VWQGIADNATVAGTVTLTVAAEDASGIKRVDFYDGITGQLLKADTGWPYSVAVDTTALPQGLAYYFAIAYDKAGDAYGADNNSAFTPLLFLNVNNVTTPVHRFKDPALGVYFYTASEAERQYVATFMSAKWKYEGIAFYGTIVPNANTVPVYRFRDEKMGVHFYTASEEEKNNTIRNFSGKWVFEGIAYYVFIPPKVNGRAQVFRFRNEKFGVHFYTASEVERDRTRATSKDWVYEGVAFYVY